MIKEGKLGLKAEVDQRAGFCMGVVKAIEKAEALLDSGQKVYCAGQIVHNEEEVARLEQKGLITVGLEEASRLEGENVLFRAHGEPPESYEQVRRNNNILRDATCPIVLKLQRDVRKAWNSGKNVWIFGKRAHPEVIGLAGQTTGEAVVFDSLEDLGDMELPGSLTLFSQTTKKPEDFTRVVEYLREKGVEVDARDTICRHVSGREEDIKTFSRQHDRVVFVAGRHSSNGRMLYEICRHHNSRCHFVSTAREVQRAWFTPAEHVGISGATSTPQWLLEAVAQKIEAF